VSGSGNASAPGPELVTLGELLVQFAPGRPGALRYVSSFEKHAAGAEANVAIAARRAGASTGWIGRLGSDEFGQFGLRILRGEGVDCSRVVFDPDHPTAVYFTQRGYPLPGKTAAFYYRSGSAGAHLSPEDLDAPYIQRARALHFSGITLAISESARETAFEAARIARAAGRLVSFDINLRLKLWSAKEARPVLERALAASEFAFSSIGDYRAVWDPDSTPEAAARALASLGPRLAIVTCDADGAAAFDGERAWVAPAPHVKVVDSTGAGDALAGGFLGGHLRGAGFEEALERACVMAAQGCTQLGDFEGVPTAEELESVIVPRAVLR
jgi:sugar/nucleoside kinase (ribokinase family)